MCACACYSSGGFFDRASFKFRDTKPERSSRSRLTFSRTRALCSGAVRANNNSASVRSLIYRLFKYNIIYIYSTIIPTHTVVADYILVYFITVHTYSKVIAYSGPAFGFRQYQLIIIVGGTYFKRICSRLAGRVPLVFRNNLLWGMKLGGFRYFWIIECGTRVQHTYTSITV